MFAFQLSLESRTRINSILCHGLVIWHRHHKVSIFVFFSHSSPWHSTILNVTIPWSLDKNNEIVDNQLNDSCHCKVGQSNTFTRSRHSVPNLCERLFASSYLFSAHKYDKIEEAKKRGHSPKMRLLCTTE